MARLQFTLGENINEILLDIAQNKMKAGDFDGALQVYEQSFEGFPTELVVGILQGKYAIRTTNGGRDITVTSDTEVVEESRTHLQDWNTIIKSSIKQIKEYCKYITWLKSKVTIDLNDYCLTRYMTNPSNDKEELSPLCTLTARYLAGHQIEGNYKLPNFQRMVNLGDENIEELNSDERKYYCIVRYIRAIKNMHNDLITLSKLDEGLLKWGLIEHVPFLADLYENCLDNYLSDFYDTEKGYHHVMCDEEVIKMKEQMYEEMLTTEYGKEYFRNGILVKDILDGYDAGYLAPDGTFYGLRGEDRELLHVQLGDMLVKKMFPQFGEGNSFDIEYALMQEGYMKIHHDRVFGAFAFRKEDVGKDYKLWFPTESQLQAIYDYANKFYGGKINTDSTFGTNMVSVSALRQMDDIALHNTFKI